MELQDNFSLNLHKTKGINMSTSENDKIQFMANVTHDLLNPLCGIQLTARMLQKTLTNPEEQRLAENIAMATTHLSQTIDHILKMSKETNKEALIECFSLRRMVMDVVKTVSITADAKNIQIYVDFSKDYVVTADKYRCFRILLNLVENAIKYTEKGHILIRSLCEDGTITLAVEDTGIGISKEKQATIFNCYTQLDAGLLDCQGIGLGLHLALLFAQQMAGEITIKSRKNKGSTFSFSFKSLGKDKLL